MSGLGCCVVLCFSSSFSSSFFWRRILIAKSTNGKSHDLFDRLLCFVVISIEVVRCYLDSNNVHIQLHAFHIYSHVASEIR